MMNNTGIIPINKPISWTSFDVVNKIKHLVRPRKVGHLGTLDPMATGVLLVTVGKATRLFDLMQEKTKTYIARFKFGYSTDTLDQTGKINSTTEHIPTLEDIEKVLPEFLGEIEQIPPKYSAKSVNGKRAYELARNDVDFELKPKLVSIHQIEILDYSNAELEIKIVCGSGTYIRSIGRDIANKVKSLATMTELVRTDVDNIDLSKCLDIQSLDKDNINYSIIGLNEILSLPKLELSSIDIQKLLNGQTVLVDNIDGLYKLNEDEKVLALVKIEKNRAKMSVFLAD